MVGLPSLCTEADCNIKASPAMAEIVDSVNVIGIVTNAFSRNSVCPPVLLFLQSRTNFTVSLSQAEFSAFSLISRSSLLPYLPSDTLHSPKLIACKVDL